MTQNSKRHKLYDELIFICNLDKTDKTNGWNFDESKAMSLLLQLIG